MESAKQRSPQEVIIKELVERISSHSVYDLSTLVNPKILLREISVQFSGT